MTDQEPFMVAPDSLIEITNRLEKIAKAEQIHDLIRDIRKAYRLQNVVYRAPFVPAKAGTDPLLFLTYDTQWVTEYLKQDYVRIDPVEAYVANAAAPIDWDFVDKTSTSEIQHFFKEAEKHV